ncbi:MAG TPA: methionyl-tRNA formyltransferase [Anaerolineales bacterium]|nr:methionyl-tRNA formyltransferase [Anaerolineales bacterium]
MTSPRVVFMGSPAFAVPSLRTAAGLYPIVGVVTQPDKPAGRGKQLTPCAVKTTALELGLPIIQPEKMRGAMDQLRAWQPDLIIVAAFGKILRADVLNLPPLGCLNVHASLLPRHRGAAPIPAAVLDGDAQTGVTLMKMDEGLDTGPMLATRSTLISPVETASQLADRLALLGAELLRDSLPDYVAGKLTPIPQDDSLATYAPPLKKEDGSLRFTESAESLARRVRAMSDWPGAFFNYNGAPIKVLRARARPDRVAAPGRVIRVEGQPAIGTAQGALVLDEIQPAGKKSMPAASYLNGNPNFVGSQL